MLQRPVISQVLNSSLPPWITFEWDWGSAWGLQEICGSYYKYAVVLGLGPLTQFLAPFHLEQRLKFLQPCITGRQENQKDVPLFQRGSPHSPHQLSPTPLTFMKNHRLCFAVLCIPSFFNCVFFVRSQVNCCGFALNSAIAFTAAISSAIHPLKEQKYTFFVLFSIDWVFSCWSTPKATYNKLN